MIYIQKNEEKRAGLSLPVGLDKLIKMVTGKREEEKLGGDVNEG